MKNQRLKTLAWWFAGVYLAWSLIVYFGTLGREPHSWWPIFLYYLIWPWSWLEHAAIQPLLYRWLAPDPKTVPASVWMLLDYITGGFYITVGTVWFWGIGRTVSYILGRVFPSSYCVKQIVANHEQFGPYRYEILDGKRVVAKYWHDYRGDDHGIEFSDGRTELGPVGRMPDFLKGGGPQPLKLSNDAIAYLKRHDSETLLGC